MFRDCRTVVFANGDRGSDNTPETDKFGDDPRVELEFGKYRQEK